MATMSEPTSIIACIHVFHSKNKPNAPSRITARYLTASTLLGMSSPGIAPIPRYIQKTLSPVSPSSRAEILSIAHAGTSKMEKYCR